MQYPAAAPALGSGARSTVPAVSQWNANYSSGGGGGGAADEHASAAANEYAAAAANEYAANEHAVVPQSRATRGEAPLSMGGNQSMGSTDAANEYGDAANEHAGAGGGGAGKATPGFGLAAGAADEHVRPDLKINCNIKDIETTYGRGIFHYFDFVRFLTWANLVYFALAVINWVAHLALDDLGFGVNDFFAGSYSRKIYTYWLVTNIITVVIAFSFGPLYFWYKKIGRKTPDKDEVDAKDYDIIPENQHYTQSDRNWRSIISFIIFIILLAVQGGITFGLSFIGRDSSGTGTNFIISTISTVSLLILNFIWKRLAYSLTNFEKHQTEAKVKNYRTFKLVFFKMMNVTIIYIFKDYTSGDASDQCPLNQIGSQFMVLILTDIIVLKLVELFAPRIVAKLRYCVMKKKLDKQADDAKRPDFDLTEEYLSVIYRQFVILIGVPVFPMISLLAFISNVIETYLDRYRLFRVCKVPKPSNTTMRNFLIFYLFLVAAFALALYP